MTPQKRLRLKTLMLALLMFVLGTVTGGAITVAWTTKRLVRFFEQPQVITHQKIIKRAMVRNLDLNKKERQAIDAVLKRHERRHEELLRKHEVATTLMRRQMVREVHQTLRPPNQKALNSWYKGVETNRFNRFTPPIQASELPTPKHTATP